MSDVIAIAAVTKALVKLMQDGVAAYLADHDDPEIAQPQFTTKPLDKARPNSEKNQLNLFLYQVTPSPHWQNTALPPYVASGNLAPRPLALCLHYIVTAYGTDDDETRAHRLLGIAMRAFHDNPTLSPSLLDEAFEDDELKSNLKDQLERVRLVYHPMTFDEVSKLWGSVQSYRVSATYEASIVLIDGARSPRSPLPVLRRDPRALPGVISPFPVLFAVEHPHGAPSAELGSTITLVGQQLDSGAEAVVVLTNPRLREAVDRSSVELAPTQRTPTRLTFVLREDQPERWPAGTYTVEARFRHPAEPERATNTLSFSLAPTIDAIAMQRVGDDVTVTVDFHPRVWPTQRVSLLLGSREIPAGARDADEAQLAFEVPRQPSGPQFVRLRVDGVDSLVVDYSADPPVFDPTQRVEVP